jgi:hypothetical protein
MVTVEATDILRLLGTIDLWSVVDAQGIPILDSPLNRVQTRRFERYLQHRDKTRDEKVWTSYITTAPAAVFGHERLYHRRAKITKVVFNWYLRAEHLVSGGGMGEDGGEQTELFPLQEEHKLSENRSAGNLQCVGRCLLCGEDMQGDSERHLYSECTHEDIRAVRGEAEAEVQGIIAELPEGLVKATASRLQVLLLDTPTRHRVWKGIITPAQVRWISEGMDQMPDNDRNICGLVSKVIKSCLRVVGIALLAIRKAAWKAGGPVVVKQHSRRVLDKRKVVDRSRTGSVATLLGIMSPKESVSWELARRERRGRRQSGGDSKGGQAMETQDRVTQWDVH